MASLPADTKTANLLPLRTPYDGVVVASDVVAGEVVDATKLLFTVADPSSLYLLLSVRQEDARYVVPGLPSNSTPITPLRTSRDAFPGSAPRSTNALARCASASCWRIRTLRLRDKSFGTAGSFSGSEPHAVVVRREAVQSTDGSQFVFVRDKDYLSAGRPKVFYVRQVRTGPATRNMWSCWPAFCPAKSWPRREVPLFSHSSSAAAWARAAGAASKTL